MLYVLRASFLLLAFTLISYAGFGQVGCGGFNGAPQPSGGITSLEAGSLCLNIPISDQDPAVLNIIASNVADGSNPNNFAVVIDWDDGSPLEVIRYGDRPMIYNAAQHRYEINNIEHKFRPKPCNATMGRMCAYKPRVYLRIAGVTCPAEFGNPPDFFRYNTDNNCPGRMELSEEHTQDPIFYVCAGTETVVRFTDRTRLNCLPPEELTGLNATRRWRRFVYGVVNTITEGGPSDQVLVNNTVVGFPYNSTAAPTVSGNSLTSSNTPFSNNNTLSVTIPATAQVGEEFHIQMQYWNICNQYDDGVGSPPVHGDRPPVSVTGIIRVVGQPPLPTPVNRDLCNNISGNLPAFEIQATGNDRVYWFRDDDGSPGTSITNPLGNNSRTFPTTSYPGGAINKSTAGVYRLWANYRRQVSTSPSTSIPCLSELVPVTLTIRPAIPTPSISSGTSPVCNNTNGVTFTASVAAGSLTANNPGNPAVSFPTQYVWSVSTPGVTIASGVNGQTATLNFNIPDANFGASSSMTVNVQLRRRYTNNSNYPDPGSNCQSNAATFPVTVYRNTQAGTISSGVTRCQGENLGTLTWSPGVGSVQSWEISSNGGVSYSPIPSFGTSSTVNPTTLALTPGTYRIRAQIRNGNCATIPSPHASYVINPNADVANAGPDQPLCSSAPFETTLSANPVTAPTTGTWTIVSRPPSSVVNFTANIPNTHLQVDRTGIYVMRWTINNGSCISQDDVIITFGEDPAMPVPMTDDFCGLTGTFSAAAPTRNENILWSMVSGPSGTASASFSSTTELNPTVTVNEYGSYTFRIRFTSPANCGIPQEANVVYNFYQAATSVAEPDKIVCVDGSTIPIAGIPVTGTAGGGSLNGRWEIVTGTGTFSSSGGAVGSNLAPGAVSDTYQPSAADYAAGTVTLRLVAIANPACGNVNDQVVLTFDKFPAAANAGPDDATCGTTISLNATAPTEGGVGAWSEITAGPTVINPSSRTSAVEDLVNGANTFRWTVSSALGVCAPREDDVIITRLSTPVANTINPNDLCETVQNSGMAQNVDLTTYNNSITGGASDVSVEWFRDAARTVPVPDITSEDVKDPLFVRVTRTDVAEACFADAAVVFDINSSPYVSNLSPSVCEDPATPGEVQNVNLVSRNNDVSLGLWPVARSVAWFEDAALTSSVPTPTDVDNITDGTTFYAEVRDLVTGCATTAEVTYQINALPLDNPIVGPTNVCLDPDNVVFYKAETLKPNHTYSWTIPAPPTGAVVTTGITTDFFVLLQFPNVVPGGVDITVVETSPEGCLGNPQTITVHIEDNPNALSIAGPDEICENEASVEFVADLFPDISYFWNVPAGASIVSGQNTNVVRVNFGAGSGSGQVMVTPSTTSGCVGSGTTHDITINARPILANNLDETVCSEASSGIVLNTMGAEPAAHYNITTRVDDAGLFQTAGPAIPPAISGAGPNAIAADVFQNKTSVPLNTRYTIVPVSAANCAGSPGVVTLTVNPEPQLGLNLGKDLCSEEVTGITLKTDVNSYPADKYVIIDIIHQDPVNPLVRIGGNPTGIDLDDDAILDDAWINPGMPAHSAVTPYRITYRIAAKSTITNCLSTNPVAIPVDIFPKPAINPIANDICSNNNVDIQLEAPNVSGANTTWSWLIQSVTTNLRGAEPGNAAGNTAVIDDMLVNESYIQGSLTYQVTAVTTVSGKTCSSTIPVSLDVNPLPETRNFIPEPLCSTLPNNDGKRQQDLIALEPQILIDETTTSIVWFSADPAVDPASIISDPTLYEVQHNIPIYAEVTNNAFSCTKVVPVTFTVNNAVAMQITETDVNCHGANNGSIYAEVSLGTGTAPYFFRKDSEPFALGNGNNYTFLALAPGRSYDIEVQDNNGCRARLTSEEIQEPTKLELTLPLDIKPVDCFFDDAFVKDRNGEIRAVAEGSSGVYSYTIFPGGLTNDTGVFPGLRPGSYTIVASDQANPACKVEFSPAIVNVPDPIEVVSLSIPSDSYGNQISCHGATNGEIHIVARGGTGEFDFLLNPLGRTERKLANELARFPDLAAGTYRITITDMNGCVGREAVATINDVPDLFLGRLGTDQDVCVNQNDDAGNADAIVELISFLGGRNPNPDVNQRYEYIWEHSVDGGPWSQIPGATSKTYDPDALSPFAGPGQYQYRRLIRSIPPATERPSVPAECLQYKGENDIVTITVREKPTVTLIGNFNPCLGDDELYYLRLNPFTGKLPITYTATGGDFTQSMTSISEVSPGYQVSNVQDGTVVRFFNIKDAYSCTADEVSGTISTSFVDASFTPEPFVNCAGEEFIFRYNAVAGNYYVWEFGDGASDSYVASDDQSGATEGHTYPLSASSQGDAMFLVTLRAALDGGLCETSFTQAVTVRQAIMLNIIGSPTEICSGETITITDNSTGVNSGTWYYTVNGNRGGDIAGPRPAVDFTLTNTSVNNPLQYMIHYEAQNDPACPVTSYAYGPINVYRAVDANFTINPNPAQMVGGLVNVTYQNTSDPLDPDFQYEWDFKQGVESSAPDGFDQRVVYNTDDQREIRLTVRNPLRPQCVDTHTQLLEISLENFLVDFNATRAGCYPLEVTVKNNSVSADRFLWELTSTNGTNERSSLREPKFNIYDAGTYTLTLIGKNDGNPDSAQVSKTIEVFSKPLAEFFLRAGQAYTNSQVKPVNQSQFTCGDCYSWDFGDGFTYDNVFEPTHFYTLEGRYTITLTANVNYGEFDIDDDGIIDGPVICSDETSKEIVIIDGGALKIPNAFTPNVNGPSGGVPDLNFTNDVFMPIMDGVEEFTMQIYDRWGNLLFESRDKNIGWDGYDKNGRLMPAGVYVYKLVLRLGDGQRTTKVGDVTLIR